MSYLLDTNVMIEAKNRHYGLDFCPAFWDWILLMNEKGQVYSIDKVADELKEGEDDLTIWLKTNAKPLFLKSDMNVLKAMSNLMSWIKQQSFKQKDINGFSSGADIYLLAHALVNNHTIVTQEVFVNNRAALKIPNICSHFNIKYINTFEMLRKEKARFVLDIHTHNN